jgi:hypothetical protein
MVKFTVNQYSDVPGRYTGYMREIEDNVWSFSVGFAVAMVLIFTAFRL